MNSVFAQMGINNISLDYAKYQAVKGSGKGDYVDFLLHYDSVGSEEGDESWMNTLMGGNDLLSSMPPEMLSAVGGSTDLKSLFGLDKSKEDTNALFDTQISALKLQLVDAFKTRYEQTETNPTVKAAKIAALYTQAASANVPSRFLS